MVNHGESIELPTCGPGFGAHELLTGHQCDEDFFEDFNLSAISRHRQWRAL